MRCFSFKQIYKFRNGSINWTGFTNNGSTNDGQSEVQIFPSNQKSDHIFHNRSLLHFFSTAFP